MFNLENNSRPPIKFDVPMYAFHQAENLLTLVLYFTLFASGAEWCRPRVCDQ